MTVPINWGNSGGPLFDDEGRVVGVKTRVFRKSENTGLALEAINLALQIGYVHEALTDTAKSLDRTEIAAVLRKDDRRQASGSTVVDRAIKVAERYEARGYRMALDKAFSLASSGQRIIPGRFLRRGSYRIEVVSEGTEDVSVVVVSASGQIISTNEDRIGPDASLSFNARSTFTGSIYVTNRTEKPAVVILKAFEK